MKMRTYAPDRASLPPAGGLCGRLSAAIWAGVAEALAPALRLYLRRRVWRGKEIAGRVRERRGITTQPRPEGPLLWLHAVSVGETLSILPVIAALRNDRPDLGFLVTTATTTAARLLVQRLHELPDDMRVIHQFMPLDVPTWMRRFVRHWHPDGAVLAESELWPNMVAACRHEDIPLVLINGRMSDRSYAMWQRLPCLIGRMLRSFAWICARSDEDARRFRALGAGKVALVGDLKDAAPALPHDDGGVARIRKQIGQRPVWIAASTHPGEEEIVLRAAELARRKVPGLLTILIPRHPERGAALLRHAGPETPRRALGQSPRPHDPVWICDTLGEMGLFYALHCPVLMGNSLLSPPEGGGHNPMEPARQGNALATGPAIANFRQAYGVLGDAVTHVSDERTLAQWLEEMLCNPQALRHAIAASSSACINDTHISQRVAWGILRAVYS
ncbi:3-deoxy-D-manno-octulosonic acid transferase [Novacetimonas pomaceti]|nr:3-deoxy-D-manno-octulosonic acid transferase [Novacetimonas pomaceti]